MAIRLLVVDDNPAMRQGVALLLANTADIEAVGYLSTLDAALDAVAGSPPDVVLMDVSMGESRGLKALVEIRELSPQTAVIMFSMHDDPGLMAVARASGAAGYVLKDEAFERLLPAISQVAGGGQAWPD